MKRIIISLSLLLCFLGNIQGQAGNSVINTFPYLESFENPSDLAWKIYDMDEEPDHTWKDNTASNFVKTGTHSIVHTPGVTAQEGWLVSPKIAVPTGENPSFSVWMKNQFPNANCTNRIRISTGSGNPVTHRDDFQEKWSAPATSNEVWEKAVIDLSPYKGQEIYIAFQYQAPGFGGLRWYIDDVSIVSLADKDAGVSAITQPVEGVNLSTQETVSVIVKNYGFQELTNIPVSFEVNGQWVATETVAGPIASMNEVSHTFTQKANLSATQLHTIKAYTTLPDEQATDNDSVSIQVRNYGDCSSSIPLMESFEDNRAMFCWNSYELGEKYIYNGELRTWAIAERYATTGKRSIYHENGPNQDSWLVTSQIHLSSTGTHFLSFESATILPRFYGKHSVLISTRSADPESGDFQEIWTETSPSSDPVPVVLNLKDQAGEAIYIAFRYEGNNTDSWYIDDVHVYKIPYHDAGITAITSPVKGKNLTDHETVTIQVKNSGSETITELPVTFKVNNQEVTETLRQPIRSLEEISYTFQTQADLSAVQKHQMQVSTGLPGDEVPDNDRLTIQVTNFGDGIISTFPYRQGFEDDDDTYLWKKESSSTYGTWSYLYGGGLVITAPYNGSRNACFYVFTGTGITTKLITQPLDLSTLSAPLLKFWYAQEMNGLYQDILRVYYKNSATGSWTRIFDGTGQGIDQWTEKKIDLPNPSNDYYIAFEGNARIGNGIFLDDIEIANATDKDVTITEMITPVSGPNRTDSEVVSIRVKNFGAQPVSSIPVCFKIANSNAVCETIQATLTSFRDTVYTFRASANLSEVKTHPIEMYADLSEDENRTNDTLRVSVINYGNNAIMGVAPAFTTCDMNFVDEGWEGEYSFTSETQTAVFYPGEAGKQIQVVFNRFHTSPADEFLGVPFPGDTLVIYDGNTALETNRIAAFVGDLNSQLPKPVTSQAADGALTFAFKKLNISSNEGWEARIACVDPTSGVPAPESNSETLRLYPNPAEHVVFISSVPEQSVMYLSDLSGRTLQAYTGLSGTVRLDLNFPAGIYVVRISSPSGQTIKKLILK